VFSQAEICTLSSSSILPSGRATILLGDDLTAVEAVHEIPLIPEVPESEDVFAKELEEVRRIARSIDHQLTRG